MKFYLSFDNASKGRDLCLIFLYSELQHRHGQAFWDIQQDNLKKHINLLEHKKVSVLFFSFRIYSEKVFFKTIGIENRFQHECEKLN